MFTPTKSTKRKHKNHKSPLIASPPITATPTPVLFCGECDLDTDTATFRACEGDDSLSSKLTSPKPKKRRYSYSNAFDDHINKRAPRPPG